MSDRDPGGTGTMRAVVHSVFGAPEEVLAVEDRPIPEPGAGEVRLRIVLSPIHNHDLWTVRGTYGVRPDLPSGAGTEALGVVDALGDGVDRFAIGQRVVGTTLGVWAEYAVVGAAGLVPVPDGVPDEAASQLVSMPFSAVALLESLGLAEGDVLVQNAANGAVGRMVAQLGKARGLRVVGLVRRTAAVDELAAQGIGDVVATSAEGWQDRVRRLVGDAPVRAGVDSVGGPAAGDVLSLLGEGGELVVFGAMESPALSLASGDLIFKQATVRGFWMSRIAATMSAADRGRMFRELVTRLGSGELTLPVHATYALEDVRDAVRANAAPGRGGKILLRP